ncbi:capsid assembly scaffolding protein Gp46 family protein [Brochothrix thermosphacta]|uniref:capsid assembly scaffolding protein Gp46 family protein n=1 Tax=Brochothrix thermosphacta TaxID=2756 RepID=UPI0003E86348|nr:DUF4355 domain-containing protein [Brochothrix thermosphacta]EUJ38196.1 hypothetical protein BTHER_02450 [Brochothrix thermosphacta DSM 20171 = FSL F6-1036]ODJ49208.1 scaffolding protein [Brochothrix thermosphacta DSM 20171 = FSL F6-1036]
MEQDNLLKLNIQYFAEEGDGGSQGGSDQTNGDETGTGEDGATNGATDDKGSDTGTDDNTAKVLEKLKARIGKEQAEKNETKTQLEQAMARIQELEQGKKGVKEKSAEEKLAEAQQQKDDEIASLQKQIKLSSMTQEADEVLKEGGLVVPKDVLKLIVSDDETKTFDNVKTFLTFLESQQQAWETKRNTGTTPKKTGGTQGTVTTEQFNAMSYLEKAKLASEQPENFKKITGGH